MGKPERSLSDVSHAELREAVEEMCQRLGIHTEMPEMYNLYEAVVSEHERARTYVHTLNIGDD